MRWNYIHIDTRSEMVMSGWKLYVYGQSLSQSILLTDRLLNTVRNFDLTTKVATDEVIRRNKRIDIPWASMVIYLTEEVFSRRRVKELTDCLTKELKGYNFAGSIPGANNLTGKLHYRYDMLLPVDPVQGVPYDNYVSLYRGEGGDYNIPNNKDYIHEHLTS